MREVIINDDYLRDSDVDFSVTRAKAIIVNKDNKIILAHNNFSIKSFYNSQRYYFIMNIQLFLRFFLFFYT